LQLYNRRKMKKNNPINDPMKVLIAAIFILIGFGIFEVQNALAYKIGSAEIKIRPGVTETYDDNITYADTNAIKDYITNFLLGLDLIYEGKLNSLKISGNLNYEGFNKHSTFNNLAEDVSATYMQELSKLDRFSLRETFVHAEEPRSFEDEFGRTSGRYSYYRNIVNAAYSRDINENLTLNANYTNQTDNYSLADLADAFYNLVGAGAEYVISSATILLLRGNYSVRKFKPGTDADTKSVTVGLRQYFTKQLYVEGRAGYDFIRSYDDTKYTRPTYEVSLTDEIDETSKLTATYNRDYSNNAYSQDIFNEWRASLAFTKQLFARLGMTISGFYGNGKYVATNIDDKLRGASAGFSYDVSDKIKLNLNYSYSETTSNISTREYKKNVIGFGIKVVF